MSMFHVITSGLFLYQAIPKLDLNKPENFKREIYEGYFSNFVQLNFMLFFSAWEAQNKSKLWWLGRAETAWRQWADV